MVIPHLELSTVQIIWALKSGYMIKLILLPSKLNMSNSSLVCTNCANKSSYQNHLIVYNIWASYNYNHMHSETFTPSIMLIDHVILSWYYTESNQEI